MSKNIRERYQDTRNKEKVVELFRLRIVDKNMRHRQQKNSVRENITTEEDREETESGKRDRDIAREREREREREGERKRGRERGRGSEGERG